ncbi:MAG: hypothetical protein DRI57_17310 [Deltaproteobacteria bacterium]|nr:MAG: hypothetical protein DRI57_17310 [Deltaproteobacteria bacterium]
MRRFYEIISLLVVFSLLNASSVFAYHALTHRLFNRYVVEKNVNGFSLNSYLRDELALSNGIEEEFQSQEGECKLEETNNVWKWIEHGGAWEDNPPPDLPDFGSFSCPWAIRAFNHYYNPVTDRGLSSFGGGAAIEWFMSQERRTIFWKNMGDYAWDDVRGYFYNALTSRDSKVREDAFADTFRGLGHLMHLVQDVSVPSHARLDPHIFYHYEDWVEHHYVKQDESTNKVSEKNPLPYPDPDYHFFGSPVEENETIENILCIIDADIYNGKNHRNLAPGNEVGLSEYANANFFSNDTIRYTEWWSWLLKIGLTVTAGPYRIDVVPPSDVLRKSPPSALSP